MSLKKLLLPLSLEGVSFRVGDQLNAYRCGNGYRIESDDIMVNYEFWVHWSYFSDTVEQMLMDLDTSRFKPLVWEKNGWTSRTALGEAVIVREIMGDNFTVTFQFYTKGLRDQGRQWFATMELAKQYVFEVHIAHLKRWLEL